MSFSLSNLQSALRGGIARPNLFAVEIDVPNVVSKVPEGSVAGSFNINGLENDGVENWFVKMLSVYGDTKKSMPFIIEAAEFPGRTIAAVEDNYSGPPISMPNDMTYNDITLTFLAAAGMRQRSFFDIWMEGMVVPGNRASSGLAPSNRAGTVAYYDDCIAEIRIHQLGDDGQTIATTYLNNAYPTSMSSMNLSWEERDTYQRFTVTFNYRYHNVNYTSREVKFG